MITRETLQDVSLNVIGLLKDVFQPSLSLSQRGTHTKKNWLWILIGNPKKGGEKNKESGMRIEELEREREGERAMCIVMERSV